MEIRTVKKIFSILTYTPFHPQWLLSRTNRSYLESIARLVQGKVLDIGCGHKAIQARLGTGAEYIGLDYYQTAAGWYGSRPDLYADAVSLPLAHACIHNVLLLDVLEHVPDPAGCLQEIHRVLLPRGRLIIQIPFLYPVHDKPLDFQRWTIYGISGMLERAGFIVTVSADTGTPLETAGLLLNIALCKSVINLYNQRNPLCLAVVFLPVVVPLINLCSLLLGTLAPRDDCMPFRYRILAEKKD